MSELFTTDIPGWVHPSLQGEVIYDATIPDEIRLPEDSTPVVLNEEVAHLFEPSGQELHLVSPNHGRSYELGPNATRDRMARIAMWHDEVGNPYTSFSLKGNNLAHGTIMQSATAPSGYIPMGLLESDALLRVVRSSRLLREAGVSTEWISRVFEPQQLIYKGELVSQAEYKRRLLFDTANERGIEEMVDIAATLEPMTFFITGRSMEINDRLADFSYDTEESVHARMKHVFRVYNATHKDDEGFRPLYDSRDSDRSVFFKKIFPTLLGTNLAKLHNIGLVHTFPSLSNVTILGGIIDLDSVRGEPLLMNDAPLERNDRVADLAMVTDCDEPTLALRGLYRDLQRLGVIRRISDVVWAQSHFLDAYKQERHPSPRKRDRTIDQLYLSGVNHNIEGSQAWGAYSEMYKRESRKMATAFWQHATEILDETWSLDHVKEITRLELDTELSRISQTPGAARGETIDLTFDTFKDIKKAIIQTTHFGSRLFDAGLAEKVEENIAAYPHLLALIPDAEARLRVLKSLANTITIKVGEAVDKKMLSRREEIVDEAMDEVINGEFFANLTDDNWHPYVLKMDSFGFVSERQADGIRVIDQKAVYGYGDVALETVIAAAHREGLPIVVSEYSIVGLEYDFTGEGYAQRAAITDAKNVVMHRLHIIDMGYDVIGFNLDKNLQNTTYVAWICEPQAGSEKPVLVISHRDPQVARALVDALA